MRHVDVLDAADIAPLWEARNIPDNEDFDLDSGLMARAVRGIVDELEPRLQRVIRMRFGIETNEHRLDEIGAELGVTKTRAAQLEEKALRLLRGRLNRERAAWTNAPRQDCAPHTLSSSSAVRHVWKSRPLLVGEPKTRLDMQAALRRFADGVTDLVASMYVGRVFKTAAMPMWEGNFYKVKTYRRGTSKKPWLGYGRGYGPVVWFEFSHKPGARDFVTFEEMEFV